MPPETGRVGPGGGESGRPAPCVVDGPEGRGDAWLRLLPTSGVVLRCWVLMVGATSPPHLRSSCARGRSVAGCGLVLFPPGVWE